MTWKFVVLVRRILSSGEDENCVGAGTHVFEVFGQAFWKGFISLKFLCRYMRASTVLSTLLATLGCRFLVGFWCFVTDPISGKLLFIYTKQHNLLGSPLCCCCEYAV